VDGHDERARRERAQRLREELDALRSGSRRPPSSPREFVEQQAREEEQQGHQHDPDASPGENGSDDP
jgi:hypothetical protein